jgi:hypothetical protein
MKFLYPADRRQRLKENLCRQSINDEWYMAKKPAVNCFFKNRIQDETSIPIKIGTCEND